MTDLQPPERLRRELAAAVHVALEDEAQCGHPAHECPSTLAAVDQALSVLRKAGWLDRIDMTAAISKLDLSEGDIVVLQLGDKIIPTDAVSRMATECKKVTGRPVIAVAHGTVISTLDDFIAMQGGTPADERPLVNPSYPAAGRVAR